MGTFYYGTRVFSKLLGYYGEAEECPVCQHIRKVMLSTINGHI